MDGHDFKVSDIHRNLGAPDELLTRLEPELGPTDELVFLGYCNGSSLCRDRTARGTEGAGADQLSAAT